MFKLFSFLGPDVPARVQTSTESSVDPLSDREEQRADAVEVQERNNVT